MVMSSVREMTPLQRSGLARTRSRICQPRRQLTDRREDPPRWQCRLSVSFAHLRSQWVEFPPSSSAEHLWDLLATFSAFARRPSRASGGILGKPLAPIRDLAGVARSSCVPRVDEKTPCSGETWGREECGDNSGEATWGGAGPGSLPAVGTRSAYADAFSVWCHRPVSPRRTRMGRGRPPRSFSGAARTRAVRL